MKHLIFRTAAVISFTLCASSSTNASMGFCSKPFAPSDFIMKPNKPYCAISRSCSKWDIDNYKQQIDRYFDQLKTYLRNVDEYRDKAYEYATCMAELD